MREPLRALVGIAGGLAILFFAWLCGHLCGFGIEALGAGIAIFVLGAVALMFVILGIVANLCAVRQSARCVGGVRLTVRMSHTGNNVH